MAKAESGVALKSSRASATVSARANPSHCRRWSDPPRIYAPGALGTSTVLAYLASIAWTAGGSSDYGAVRLKTIFVAIGEGTSTRIRELSALRSCPHARRGCGHLGGSPRGTGLSPTSSPSNTTCRS